MTRTLSKSDFKAAQQCPTKLYYKELGYPSTNDTNRYLQLLAAGGFMIETIARLLFPDGVAIDYDAGSDPAARQTNDALRAENVVLFEATLLSGLELARVDILAKRGNAFDLIEIKSKSIDGAAASALIAQGHSPFRTKKGAISSEWEEKLLDVTYQVNLLRQLFPDAEINPFLMLVDKSKTTTIDVIHQNFVIEHRAAGAGKREKVDVQYRGDASRLRADHFLTMLSVAGEVKELADTIGASAAEFAASLEPTLVRLPGERTTACGKCEYRGAATAEDPRDGFLECWGESGRTTPHILDLTNAGSISGRDDNLIDRLIAEGKSSLLEIPIDSLVKADGTVGPRSARQRVQVARTESGIPYVSPGLADLLESWSYPLRFIDFETSALAVPYHAGMHPYETTAFQWSCHSIVAPDAAPTHAEWINTVESFPNFEFASSLRDHIGLDGTIFMWSPHERTVLTHMRRQMDVRGYHDPALAAWAQALITRHNPRLVDLNKATLEHFFHPAMKGKTSIKWVLDAIWQSDPAIRALFPEYDAYRDSPYRSLPKLEIAGVRQNVEEGTGAVRAYQAMMYGAERNEPETKAKYRALLLQYCKLDTAAMVMIWDHWRRVAPLARDATLGVPSGQIAAS